MGALLQEVGVTHARVRDVKETPRPRAGSLTRPGKTRTPSSLTKFWLRPLETLVVSKSCAGFDRACVNDLTALVEAVACGALSGLKFLVFDFAHGASDSSSAADGFENLVAANAELILDTPVITVAWASGVMRGADLDFALHCSALVAQREARFSFAGDPFALLGLYAALGRKIGFVKAERLIERNELVTADEMRDLLIVKDVVETQDRFAAIERYIARFGRRYNASHALFRAQRLAMPLIDRRPLDDFVKG